MKIKVIKPHPGYGLGDHDVDDARGQYLVNAGIAEETGKSKKATAKAADKTPDKKPRKSSVKKAK